ncbi:lipopolysaccharide assembly protein LapA domain-containing protein [Agrococcus sp. SL85]|uniref:LapA family protein n=1 Tax=Agrococcus sp. SL85 TaxID=2995141 RepID=UPI00226D10BF|nr:lipopolysaccharide assembly protein LapA domain-containing protein [Agrococcus sp. SL85]WAC67216.1 lipopolysaccharide assembly protein LapA domain-containing protein [Agrococcus sp. SL85]
MTNETFDPADRRHDAAAAPAAPGDRPAEGTAPTARLDGERPAAARTGGATAAAPAADRVEPTRIQLDPSLDQHQRQGLSGGTWIALILGTVILVLLLIFILQNNVPAEFAYFGVQFSLPLGVAMLFAAIAGVLITALLGSVRLFKLGRRVRKLEKERQTIRQAIR